MRPMLKPPGTKYLNLEYDKLLSSSAFNSSLRRYNWGRRAYEKHFKVRPGHRIGGTHGAQGTSRICGVSVVYTCFELLLLEEIERRITSYDVASKICLALVGGVPAPARHAVPQDPQHQGVRGGDGRGLHSFPFPLILSLLCPFSLKLSPHCPPYHPILPLAVSQRCLS
jgi:hypothetical protein